MRPLLVLWLLRHGLPGWLAPTYFTLTVLSAVIGCLVALRLARADREDLRHESRALALACLGAFTGGSALEALHTLPLGVNLGAFEPCQQAGRAAYGGLLFALWLAISYRVKHQLTITAFFDRILVGIGVAFFGLRLGCFLTGCDYGIPTTSWLGVGFPAGSLAALDHAARGLVPPGSASLPVHPTQLYEALLGGGAVLIASQFLHHGRRDGTATLVWLGLYAGGRFLNEFLRGAISRELVFGLSRAQYVCVMVCTVVAGLLAQRFLLPRGNAVPGPHAAFA